MKKNKCSLTAKRGDFNGLAIKIIFLFILLLASAGLAQSAAVNVTLNYVWNGSDWIPWLSTADGKPKVDLNLLNISAGDISVSGSAAITKNLTVDTGTLLVDSDNNRVGIRTLSPLSILDISQNITTSANIDHNDTAYLPGFAWNMTLLNVTSVSGFPAAGTLIIGSEAITYSGVDTALNTFTGLTRGALATTAANHTNNTAVYYLIFSITRNQSLAPQLVLISDGRVGIGTAVPNQKMYVDGNINATGNITSGTGTIFIDGTNNRIGIGTTTPTQALTIIGSINVTGTSYLGSMTLESGNITAARGTFTNLNVTGTSYLGSMNFESGNITATRGTFAELNVTGSTYLGDITINADNLTLNRLISRTENISFFNASKDEKMRILHNGNVGIGTSTPTHLLTVAGDLNVTGASYLGDIVISADNLTVNEIVSKNENISFFNATKDEKIRILYDGKVGIGITNATALLDILGSTTAAASIRVQDGAQPTSPNIGDIYSDGTDLFFYDGSSWQDLTRETSSAGGWTDDGANVRLTSVADYVGIGTASPSEKLQVTGNGSFSGDLVVNGNLLSNGGQGAGGNVGGWTDDGTIIRLTTSTDAVGIGTSTPAYSLEVADSTTDGKAMNISNVLYVNASSGKVGIGTTAPKERLVVVGGVNITNGANISNGLNVVTGNVGIGTTSPSAKLHVASSTTAGGGIGNKLYNTMSGSGTQYGTWIQTAGSTSGQAIALVVNAAGGTSSNTSIWLPDTSNSGMNWGYSATTNPPIRGAIIAGNVGIGTTAPLAPLEVAGDVLFNTTAGKEFFFDVSSGRLGVGDSTPGARLQVTETVSAWTGLFTASDLGIQIQTTNAQVSDTGLSILDDGGDQVLITKGSGNVGIGTTSPKSKLHIHGGDISITNSTNSLWGTASDGAVANMADADTNAVTIAQSGATSVTHNRIYRAISTVTISQKITVAAQDGQARGSYPTTHGGPGADLGMVYAAIGSKGIPPLIRPGGGSTLVNGGVIQILAKGNVAINANIDATGNYSALEGGGGGGLVVIVSNGTISGSAAINVSGSDGGNTTANAKGGGGGYSGAPGGHAGIGGSGGGSGDQNAGGAGGTGLIAGNSGGTSTHGGGAGGGSLDNAGGNTGGVTGGNGAAGDDALSANAPAPTILLPGADRPASVAATAGAASSDPNAGGDAGSNGGGGGGGGGGAFATTNTGGNGGDGGDGGSGGGGAGRGIGAGQAGGDGGNGAAGNVYLYVLSGQSVYAGLPGGQGGGGGGGRGSGDPVGSVGSGGAGASGISPFVASMGNGAGGVGASGADGALTAGGAGGAGGNGGGAAGLVILIAPSVTYSGTVTGRLVIIQDNQAVDFIKGLYVN